MDELTREKEQLNLQIAEISILARIKQEEGDAELSPQGGTEGLVVEMILPASCPYILRFSYFAFSYTVEPLNNGHIGDEHFVHCSEVVPSSEVEMYGQYT